MKLYHAVGEPFKNERKADLAIYTFRLYLLSVLSTKILRHDPRRLDNEI